MTHDNWREMIQRELDGDLSAEELNRLNAHTATCADCRREWDDYKQLQFGLNNLGKVMPERSFVTLMEPELKQVLRQKKRRVAPIWWQGLSAAAVVVLALGFTTDWHYGLNQSAPPGSQLAATTRNTAPARPVQVAQTPQTHALPPTTTSQPAPQLIKSEKVKERPQVQVAAVSQNDLALVKNQTGVTVEPQKVAEAKVTPGNNNQVVLVTVDSKPTDVKVNGDNVTVVVAADKPAHNDGTGSDVHVYGISSFEEGGTKTVTFTDPEGHVIDTAQVDLGHSSPAPTIGAIDEKAPVNQKLQQEIQADPQNATWAQDTIQVVTRHLRDLGFAKTAVVQSTDGAGHVQVEQGGTSYLVTLAKTSSGTWLPRQIGRAISERTPSAQEKAVLAYFDRERAAGHILGNRTIYVIEQSGEQIKVQVNIENQDSSGHEVLSHRIYDFTLLKVAEGQYHTADTIRVTFVD